LSLPVPASVEIAKRTHGPCLSLKGRPCRCLSPLVTRKAVLERLARNLTPSQMVTLAATVALANWTNRFNEIMGIELP
jgi:hypothetical protein